MYIAVLSELLFGIVVAGAVDSSTLVRVSKSF